jgi:gamma-glutamylcyclotransferase (GGCT)/AIG2-like uncharacterized protein YtfP
VLKNERQSTVCAVWRLNKKNEQALDYYEGYPNFYDKQSLSIDLENGEQANALIYIMQPAFHQDYTVPSEKYVNTCIKGYEDCGINNKQLTDAYSEIYTKNSEQ